MLSLQNTHKLPTIHGKQSKHYHSVKMKSGKSKQLAKSKKLIKTHDCFK